MSVPYNIPENNIMTVILTDKAKEYILEGNLNKFDITKFSIGDQDINYLIEDNNNKINTKTLKIRGSLGDCAQSINLKEIKIKIKV